MECMMKMKEIDIEVRSNVKNILKFFNI